MLARQAQDMDAKTSFFPRENPLYATYAFYAAILVFKIILMGPLTARYRFGKRVSDWGSKYGHQQNNKISNQNIIKK